MTYKKFIDNIITTRGRHGCGDIYHEKHHIIPKCLGGQDKEENYIDLFAHEHYKAHKLLALENPDQDGLQYAWWMMSNCTTAVSNKRSPVTAEDYEQARVAFARTKSKAMTGVPMAEKTKEKIRQAKIGTTLSEDARFKVSKNHADMHGANHPRHRPVICVETGEEYWGATEANKETGISISSIRKACITQKSVCGLHWCYFNDPMLPVLIGEYKGKELEANKVRTKYIQCIETRKIYKNAKEASKATLNTSSGKILRNCNMVTKKAGPYHWRYVYMKDGEFIES